MMPSSPVLRGDVRRHARVASGCSAALNRPSSKLRSRRAGRAREVTILYVWRIPLAQPDPRLPAECGEASETSSTFEASRRACCGRIRSCLCFRRFRFMLRRARGSSRLRRCPTLIVFRRLVFPHQGAAARWRGHRRAGTRAAACPCPTFSPRGARCLRLVNPANEPGQHVRRSQVEVVAGAVEIGRHDTRSLRKPYCRAVRLAHLDAGDLGDGVPLIGGLERAGEQAILGIGCGASLG